LNSIDSNERITRYIFERTHFAPSTGRVKYSAFLPKKRKTSVYRISKLEEQEIWDIGIEYVSKERNMPLLARGDILAAVVLDNSLGIVPDTAKHPKHANIIDWPDNKEEQMLIAKQLEPHAKLILKQ
jgi:hypothetical protein